MKFWWSWTSHVKNQFIKYPCMKSTTLNEKKCRMNLLSELLTFLTISLVRPFGWRSVWMASYLSSSVWWISFTLYVKCLCLSFFFFFFCSLVSFSKFKSLQISQINLIYVHKTEFDKEEKIFFTAIYVCRSWIMIFLTNSRCYVI